MLFAALQHINEVIKMLEVEAEFAMLNGDEMRAKTTSWKIMKLRIAMEAIEEIKN